MHSKISHTVGLGMIESIRLDCLVCLVYMSRLISRSQLFRLCAITLFVLCSQLASASAIAAEKKSDEQDKQSEQNNADERSEPSAMSKAGSMVDEAHGKISDRFSQFIVQIDDFIGSGESGEQLNKSWARIRVDTVKPGAEKLDFGATVKLRIVLPQSEQRFRLLLSSEDDASSAANTDAAQREQIASTENNDVAFALRFIRTVKDRFRLKYDVGARYKDDKAQLFGRFIVGYTRNSMLGFTNSLTNNYTYFSASGYQNSFRIDSRRTFFGRESLFFRNTIELSWRKGLSGVGIGETIGFYADLGKRRAIAFEGLTGYATSLNEGNTDKYRGAELRIRYRQNIWRPWLYYEIWPSVSWSSSNNYEQAYGGLFRVEVTLGQI